VQLIEFLQTHWRAAVEISVLWVLIYQIYRLFRATRGARILVGLTVVIILLTLGSQVLELEVIEWIIKSAAAILAFALLVIFQPELRNGLARLGSANLFSFSTTQQKVFLELLTETVVKLSKKRFGSCIFPVSQKDLTDRSLGLRHRAGVGITDETDAVAVIVSEETGSISIVVNGKIYRNLTGEEFRERLEEIFITHGETIEEMDPEELDGKNRSTSSSDRDLVSD